MPAAAVPPTVDTARGWNADIGSTFQGPQSQCAIAPDGVVTRAPPPLASELPFLFNLSEQALPSKKRACSHCAADVPGWHGDPCKSASMPQACCGVCQFEKRICSRLYPGQNLSEAAAAGFMAQGHPMQDFSPCELFQRIRGRTLWFIGDSQTWHFYYAAECFLREFAPSLRRTDPLSRQSGGLRNLTTARLTMCRGDVRFDVLPICLDLAHGTRVCVIRVDTAADMVRSVLPALLRHVPDFRKDLMVLNTGLHYYQDVACVNNTCQVPGKKSAYVRDLQRLADWRAAHRQRLPQTVWMDTPTQHFPGTGGYAGSFHAQQCSPLDAWQRGEAVARASGTWNVAAAPLVPLLADAHLQTWEASVPLWRSHMPGECTHWCSPGAYHIWLYLLNGVLRDGRLGSPVAVQ